MKSKKTISISLSSNTQKDDFKLAKKLLFYPTSNQERGTNLEKKFQEFLGQKHCFAFNSGRVAFLAILQALDVKENDEIIIQAFTCVALVNPILFQKAKPIFCDVNDTLNIDIEDLKKKITKKTKVVVVQHTFGWPGDIEQIKKIVQDNHVFLIEDCAHALGAKYQGKYCGTFGDASFFSFGRDKIISSVFGGIASTNNLETAKKIEKFQQNLKYPSSFWTFRQLLHPILMQGVILPLYVRFNLGKIILVALQKLHILSKALKKQEKQGIMRKKELKRMSGKLAILASHQLDKLGALNEHRKTLANFYAKALKNSDFISPFNRDFAGNEPVFLKYPILTKQDPKAILSKAKQAGILLDDGWRSKPVMPPDVNLAKIGYQMGSCPKAEAVAKTIISLPTHINTSQEDISRIKNVLCGKVGRGG